MARRLPSLEFILKIVSYDPETGLFKRKKKTSNFCSAVGEDPTYLSGGGYRVLTLCGEHWLAHRVAWKIYYGTEPPAMIDHKDRDRTNNRIDNLRETDDSRNQANSMRYGKHRGVSWDKRRGKWFAKVTHKGQQIALGRFDDFQEAVRAVEARRRQLWGEFSV